MDRIRADILSIVIYHNKYIRYYGIIPQHEGSHRWHTMYETAMESVLRVAQTAGVAPEAIMQRIAADEKRLSSQQERAAYLLGMQAALLTIATPITTMRPNPTSPVPSSPRRSPPAPVHAAHPSLTAPTLRSMGRQRAIVPAVSPEDGPMLPTEAELASLLADSTPPLSGAQRHSPTRWLLLYAHDACHGHDCLLQQQQAGIINSATRERATVSLFWKLVGLGPSDPTRASMAKDIYGEAQQVMRKRGTGKVLSQSLRRWLICEPVSIAAIVRGGADTFISSHRSPPRVVASGDAASPTRSSMTRQQLQLARRPVSASPGFGSTTSRPLQPTADVEAAVWAMERPLLS